MAKYRLQWRELRRSRGGSRKTQRSVRGLDRSQLIEAARHVAQRAHHGEFRVGCEGDDCTSTTYTTLLLLETWTDDSGLPEKPEAIWPNDVRDSAEQATAIDALRHAFARVAMSGALSEARVCELLGAVRAEIQTLASPVSSPWRS